MVPLRRGKIINFCSLLTFQGGLTVPAYAAAKGALGQVTKALSNEWSQHNVQVNGICPGYIATDMCVSVLLLALFVSACLSWAWGSVIGTVAAGGSLSIESPRTHPALKRLFLSNHFRSCSVFAKFPLYFDLPIHLLIRILYSFNQERKAPR